MNRRNFLTVAVAAPLVSITGFGKAEMGLHRGIVASESHKNAQRAMNKRFEGMFRVVNGGGHIHSVTYSPGRVSSVDLCRLSKGT